MSEAVVIEMSDHVLREVDALARRLGRTREACVLDLVARAAADEGEQVVAIELGLAQLDRGEGVSQEEMERLAESFPVSA